MKEHYKLTGTETEFLVFLQAWKGTTLRVDCFLKLPVGIAGCEIQLFSPKEKHAVHTSPPKQQELSNFLVQGSFYLQVPSDVEEEECNKKIAACALETILEETHFKRIQVLFKCH